MDALAVRATVATAAVANQVVVTNGVLIADSLDQPANESNAGTIVAGGLANVVRQAHLIKRIVGHCFVGSDSNTSCFATFGIIVDRTDNTGALANLAAWSPFAENSSQKRWLFRRTWALGTGINGGTALTRNTNYGSMREGAQIDSKMKARLSYEERLFLIMAVQNGPDAAAVNVTFTPLLRLFAKPITGDNR